MKVVAINGSPRSSGNTIEPAAEPKMITNFVR